MAGQQISNVANSVAANAAATDRMATATNNAAVRFDSSSARIENTVSTAAGQLDTSVKDATGALDRTVSTATQQLDETGKILQKTVGDAGDDLIKVAEKTTDTVSTQNVALLSAVAAISAAAAGTLYNFVATGTYKLARTAYYEAIGEFKPEEIDRRMKEFDAALKDFQKLSPEIENLEKKLSLNAGAMMVVTSGQPPELIIATLEKDLVKLKQRHTLEASTPCLDCLQETDKQMNLLKKQIADLKAFAKASGADVPRTKGQLCSEVDAMYLAWSHAEKRLTDARRAVIQNARVFMGLVSANVDVKMDFQEQRKQNNACSNRVEDKLDDISSKDKERCRVEPFSEEAVCRTIHAYRLQLESCEIAASSLVTENHKADLEESAATMNSQIANFSKQLGQADCRASDENGACISAGEFSRMSKEFVKNFEGFEKDCADRSFAGSLMQKRNRAEKAVAESAEPKKSFWSNLFRFGAKPKAVGPNKNLITVKHVDAGTSRARTIVSDGKGNTTIQAYNPKLSKVDASKSLFANELSQIASDGAIANSTGQ